MANCVGCCPQWLLFRISFRISIGVSQGQLTLKQLQKTEIYQVATSASKNLADGIKIKVITALPWDPPLNCVYCFLSH